MSETGKKPKIYLISPVESKLSERGTRHPRLAEMLFNRGYEVCYLTSNFNHNRKEHFQKEYIQKVVEGLPYPLKVFRVLGYKKILSFSRVLTHIQLSLKVYFFLKGRVSSGDIVIIPSRPPELIWLISRLKRIAPVKLVLDIRDTWPDAFPLKTGLRRKLFEMYCDFFLKKSVPQYDHYFMTSPNFSNWLGRYAPQKEGRLIPLGFDIDRWIESKPVAPEMFQEKIHAAYIGNFTRNFPVFDVIKGVNKVPGVEFFILGSGECASEIERCIEDTQTKNSHFLGLFPKEEIPAKLQSFHLTVIPMKIPGYPNKLFDSIAAYRPILVLGEHDASQFIRKHDIGWVCPFEVSEIHNFFQGLTQEMILEKSKNIATIRDRYSKENLYKEYIETISHEEAVSV